MRENQRSLCLAIPDIAKYISNPPVKRITTESRSPPKNISLCKADNISTIPEQQKNHFINFFKSSFRP
jgi:hypothetical protein